MKLNLFSDFSLRVMMFAAVKQGSFQVDEVAAAFGISRHHLAKVVQRLARLGYLKTRRGRGGGLSLGRDAADIRIGKLIQDTEEQVVMVECFDPATNTCRISGNCRLKGVLAEAMTAFYDTLNAYTLAELTSEAQGERLAGILLSRGV